ncbi:CNH-domain-containing protein [Schizophyllum commune Tattone D]|nr:CNH-domain-containing protein [Schizophyllum commune Tattone D]
MRSVFETIHANTATAAAATKRPKSPNHKRKTPIVYPALLSRVAEAFRDRIQLSDRVKDGLTYKNAFDGREAVDKIAYIIKTTDRTLALLLGRALDAQKFFHDVTYDHRLRDSPNELYQFRTTLPSPFVSGETVQPPPQPEEEEADESPLPSGVFTLLTDCYSPTCSRDALCYSIVCPRRLEQQARLSKQQQHQQQHPSSEALHLKIDKAKEMDDEAEKQDRDEADALGEATLWIHTVPKEIVDSVSDKEKKRQEAINEVIYTERDFVRDMEYLRDFWIKRLQDSDVIPIERRTQFLEQVFWNVFDIIAVNTRLRDALTKRQKSYAVVEKISDIFLDAVPHFTPFISYGAHQMYGKYEFEKEKSSNPAFAQFVETTERLPESRKLELNAYLTKPTTRLARYPLLLGAVLKHTPPDSPDAEGLPKVIEMVREFLKRVNEESGKTENRFNLIQLDQQLIWKQGDEVNLRLRDEGRELVYKGTLARRGGESGDLVVWLFDHAVLFAKSSKAKGHGEMFKVYRRPIPLELLAIAASADDMSGGRKKGLTRRGSFGSMSTAGNPLSLTPASTLGHSATNLALDASPDGDSPATTEGNSAITHKSSVLPFSGPSDKDKAAYWISFTHLGRKAYNLTLYAPSPVAQKKWVEAILKQQAVMRDRSRTTAARMGPSGAGWGGGRVNCAAPFAGGRRIVYGTDDGVYMSDLREPGREPQKVVALLDVSQVDVLEDYQLLIVLSERQVITFPLDALDPIDPMAPLKRAKRISSHTSFFKAGFCLGRVLVCIVKSSQLSSTFKTLEPIDQNVRGRAKPTFRKLLQGGNDTLKLFREFYIPVESTSIHYLKTKMCVGCSRGFEIVDLETLDTQGLLDPNDESLEFVHSKTNLRPMAIYRIQNEFLLCYDEFAFYVNKTGRRSRKDFMVYWEGNPTGFALHEPYVLAFEPSFVEIRHIETGHMSQVIQGNNLRLLFADTPPSVQNGGSMYYNSNPYQPPAHTGYDYNPYANPGYGYPQRPPQQPYMQQFPTPNPYMRHVQGVGRDEIILVSDDKVLTLRPTMPPPGQQQFVSDTASVRSMPR